MWDNCMVQHPGSGRVALGVVPVDLHSETRLVVEANEAVARLGAADQEVVRQGVARRIAVRFHAEAAARQGRDEMRVQLGRGVRDRKSTRLNSSHVAISYAVF